MTEQLENTVKTGDILKHYSPIDDEEVLSIATVTQTILDFKAVDIISLQESDGNDPTISYPMPDNLNYQIVANSKTLGKLHGDEYRAVLKHLKVPAGPLSVMRSIMKLKSPQATTNAEFVEKIIQESIQEGKLRADIFKQKVASFAAAVEQYKQ